MKGMCSSPRDVWRQDEVDAIAFAFAVGEAGWQVMNEVTIHRGRYPHLTAVDAFFDGEHLTEAVVS